MTTQDAYAKAGVNIDEGNSFADMVKARIAEHWPDTAAEFGGFAGRVRLKQQVDALHASTDGAGTKPFLAGAEGTYRSIGYCAGVMAAQDLALTGVKVVGLLDMISTGRLHKDRMIRIIDDLLDLCVDLDCPLLGGETAEHPGMYKYPWMVDVSVTAIGVPIPDFEFVPMEAGMKLVGWPSYGPACNGYSLLRRVFGLDQGVVKARKQLREKFLTLGKDDSLGDVLLVKTPLWTPQIEEERRSGVRFAGHAHITGGGLVENPPRIIPQNLKARIDLGAWERPPIFRLAQVMGGVSTQDMLRTFNNGIMVLSVIHKDDEVSHPEAVTIGEIFARKGDEPQVEFHSVFNDALSVRNHPYGEAAIQPID